MIQDLLEVWRTHDEINVYLLEQISHQGYEAATLLKNGHDSKGRTVARVFYHMQEVCQFEFFDALASRSSTSFTISLLCRAWSC